MKIKTLVITFLPVIAFAAGCNKEQTTSQQIDKTHGRVTPNSALKLLLVTL